MSLRLLKAERALIEAIPDERGNSSRFAFIVTDHILPGLIERRIEIAIRRVIGDRAFDAGGGSRPW